MARTEAYADSRHLSFLRPKRHIAFIDLDGTVREEPPESENEQVDRLDQLVVLPGVLRGLRLLKANGYALWLVTNQDGLDTASYQHDNFWIPHDTMNGVLNRRGLGFDKQFICPHFPYANCDCRKPKISPDLKDALRTVKPDEHSFVIGDRQSDEGLADKLGVEFFTMPTNGNFYDSLRTGLDRLYQRLGQPIVASYLEDLPEAL